MYTNKHIKAANWYINKASDLLNSLIRWCTPKVSVYYQLTIIYLSINNNFCGTVNNKQVAI